MKKMMQKMGQMQGEERMLDVSKMSGELADMGGKNFTFS